MTIQRSIKDRYPKRTELLGGKTATIRLMEPTDKARMLEFARSLPERDLLFLRTDITDPAIVDLWIDAIRKGQTVTLVAEISDEIVAYASVHLEQARWTRRVGEIRINASPRHRGLGLGRQLTAEAMEVARMLDLKKMTAMMTPDQTGARSAFERLGFHIEALLADWVEDRQGQTHDLLVMSHDVSGFTDQAVA
ncbi:MAG: GNAT family N-acetyltransferase [Candidatus Binataceae bacterium]